ncbi:MAG TPA: carboxypeptidase-like regulatory domain-containing protein, partial [Chitinophagaceae bacterium]|nr:carboxypeptidase-like regulatory domain-containing protein [Chitinophagaceae bacterium]
MKYTLILLLVVFSSVASAQLYKLSGTIMNERKEPLPLASIEVKQLSKGSVSKDDGSYEFFLERGKYDLVLSMVGYKPKVVTVFINNEDVTENIIMETGDAGDLGEVIVRAKAKDRA